MNARPALDVANLRLAWTFSTGVLRGHEAAPLVVNDTMYIVTPYPNILYALDLTQSGAAIKWRYEPKPVRASQGVACCDVVNRGATYADGKIFYNTLDNHAVAIDANTGQEVWKTKNERREGFENKIAELIARELNATVRYTWWAQRRGFIRNPLRAKACDVVMGIPSDYERVLPTKPYYRSTYAFLYRKDKGFDLRSLDDPILRQIKIGVHLIGDDYTTPPPPMHSPAARSSTTSSAIPSMGIISGKTRRPGSSRRSRRATSTWRSYGGPSRAISPNGSRWRWKSSPSPLTLLCRACRLCSIFRSGSGRARQPSRAS